VRRNVSQARRGAALAAALAFVLAGCVSAGSEAQLQTDLDTLQQQVWRLQKDNVALTQQLAQAGSPSPAADPAAAEVRVRLDSLAHELEVMRTRADESDQRLAGLAGDLRTLRDALETFTRTQVAMTQAAPAAQPGSAPAQGPAAGPAEKEGAGATAAPPGAAGGGSDLYRQAYADYAKGNPDRGLQELDEFIRLHPADDLADDAEFLAGEIYFSQGKYPESVAAYDRLLKEHAGGDKAPAAYLKKGLALLEMNRTADAVIQLQHVVTAYPKSDEARIARDRLKALGLRER